MYRLATSGILTMALFGCGKTSTSETKGIYFMPRSAIASLPPGSVKVVGTHDSGLLVQAATPDASAMLQHAAGGFRFDEFAQEFTHFDYPSMEQQLKTWQQKFPNLTHLETYGTTREGRAEYALTVGSTVAAKAKPELMITAATHGNEVISVDVILGLMEKLLQGYGKDQRLTKLVDTHTLHFVPAVCADSYVAETRAAEGRDPNRDYPYPDEPSRDSVGCISDVMTYFNAHDISGSLDYHSAASMIMFPWAYTYDHIPDADYQAFDGLTTRMAETNGYEHGDIASTIYIAQGSSADYYYWHHHTTALAVEISHNLAAAGDNVDRMVEENSESTWRFVENF